MGGGWLYQGDLDDVDEYEDEDNSFRGESLILQLRQLSSQVEIDHRGGATASQRWPLGRDNDNDNDDNGTKVRRSASLEGEVVGVRRHSRSGLSTRGVGKALSVADMLRQELADSEERTRYHDNLSMAPTRPSSSMLGGGVIAASSRAAQLGAAKRHAHPVPPPAPAASRLAAKGRPTRHR